MPDLEKLLEGLKKGDRLSLSKCITLVESEAEGQQEDRYKLIEAAESLPGSSFRLAVTGVPGAGKSTLIDWLGMEWIAEGHKVAVLAVDPSSSISNGSILGDKTRMTELSKSQNAFIRPSPTRLQLGGVAAHTFETILVCEAAGFDRIIIETVGVGQSETLASQLSDAVLLLLVSGTGDDLQGVKRGILESADIVFVNKADGANKNPAKVYAMELDSISKLWPKRRNDESATVLAGSSYEKNGLDLLFKQIESFHQSVLGNGSLNQNRDFQKIAWMKAMFYQRLEILIKQKMGLGDLLLKIEKNIEKEKKTVSQEVDKMIQEIKTRYFSPE
jgi:LAO/AO transport system kinase